MHRSHTIIRTLLAILILFANTPTPTVEAASTAAFGGYGAENISLNAAFWDLAGSAISADQVEMNGESASARFVLDVSGIAAAVDQGGLEIAFSAGAAIADEDPEEELDEASIVVGFGAGSGSPDSTSVLTRGLGDPGSTIALSSGASIPSGARYVFITLQSTQHGSENTASFSSLSLRIHDNQVPSLTYSLTPAGWTNQDVQVTITASDGDSGIAGIYDSENTQVSATTSYSFTTSQNGSWTFTARDNAGKTSDVLTAVVTGIDTVPPAQPVLTVDTTEWSNVPVPFSLSEVTAGEGESPVSRQFRLGEGEWQAYAEPAAVSQQGSVRLEGRTVDAAGNASEAVSETVKVDTSAPEIGLSYTPHLAGGATVSAAITDLYTAVVEQKYASGSQDAAFFSSDGEALISGSFEVAAGGVYSVYALDEAGNAAVQTIEVNTYPVISVIEDQGMDEDTEKSFTFTVSDLETASGELVVSAASDMPGMLPDPVVVNSEGTVTLTLNPAENQNGSANVAVIVTDGGGLSAGEAFGVTVNAINDGPTATDDSAETNEDIPVVIEVLTNDSDVEGTALTIANVGEAEYGTVTNNGTSVTYTPDTDFVGDDNFTYTVTDGELEDEAEVSLNVYAINDLPVISEISDQIIAEEGIIDALPFTFTDVDSPEKALYLSWSSSNESIIPYDNINVIPGAEPGSYTISLSPLTNTNTWNASEGRHEPVIITLIAGDEGGESTETFSVTINAVNDVPGAVDDSAETDEEEAVIISVLANDSDTEGEALAVTAVTQPAAGTGTAAISGGGQTVTYTPAANFNGSATFSYTVRDASGGTSTASVTVTVASINDNPSGVNDAVTLNEDIVTTIDVLANDQDADLTTTGGLEALTIVSVSGQMGGASTAIVDNKVVYTPALNYSGSDSFTYTFEDEAGASSSATVNLTIKPVNDMPVFTLLETSYNVNEDEELTIDFEISDVETLTKSLMLQVVSDNQTRLPNASLTLTGLGNDDPATSLTLKPAKDQNGPVEITLNLGDGFEVTTQTFDLEIIPVNDDPVAHNDSLSFTEDESIVVAMNDLLNNDTDIDGDPLAFAGVVEDSLGAGTLAVEDAGANTYRFTPPANFDGNTTFQYLVSDGTANDTGTVTLRATPVNDEPTIEMQAGNPGETDEDTPVVLQFTINDQETNAGALSVQAGSNNSDIVAASGLAISCTGGDCTLTVTPNTDKNGPVTLTASVSDGVFLVETQVNLTINPLPDAPVAKDDTYNIEENGVLTFTPLENDYDADGDVLTIDAIDQSELKGTLVDNGGGSLTYTAPANLADSDSFTYTLAGGTAPATVTFTVSDLDNLPAITGIANQFINEDGTTGDLAFTVSDPDSGDVLTVTVESSDTTLVPEDEAHLLLNHTGSNYTVRVTPDTNLSGKTTITLTVSDGKNSTTETFDVTVYPVNDLPQAVDDEVTTAEDTVMQFNPLLNDLEPESTLKIVAMTSPSHGRLSVATGVFSYAPYSNYFGADSFTYTITDGEATDTATVNITITPVNDPPRARSDWKEVPNTASASATINVLTNDDTNGDPGETLTITGVTIDPAFGTAVIQGNSILYTRPNPAAVNSGSFTYEITDDGDPAKSATATVYIADHFGPSFGIDSAWTGINEDAETIDLPLTIYNGYGGTYTLELISAAETSLGTFAVPNPNGNILQYTPKLDANGQDTAQVRVSLPSEGLTDTATITIDIYPVNDPPTITPVNDIEIDEDGTTETISATIGDVDTEHPADSLIFEAYADNPALVLDEDIEVTRTGGEIELVISPIANRHGSTVVTLLASDGLSQTQETFTLTVNSVNDIPVVTNPSASLYEDTTKDISVLTPNADVDGDALTVTVATNPANGTAVVNPDKTIKYTPAANFNGGDSFTFTLDDGNGGTATGTVTLSVTPVNDPPTITNLAYLHQTLEDVPATVTLTIGDIDEDELEITFSSANTDVLLNESILMSSDGTARTLALTPVGEASGASIVTVTVSDGTATVEQDFQLTVTPVNDLPTARNDSASTNEDESKIISVLTNDSDIEDPSLNIASVTVPGHGTATNNMNGTITYRPASNYYGEDSFQYTVVDDNDGRATATVSISIAPVNDKPTAPNYSKTTLEDTPIEINLMTGVSDVENDPVSVVSVGTPSKGSIPDPEDYLDGVITYKPDDDATGVDTFTYTVSDGALSSTGTVTVNISAENDAPRLNADTPWELDEDTPEAFAVDVYDPETPSDNLVIRITSSRQDILPDTSIELQGSGRDKELLLTPNKDMFGELSIHIEATDGAKTTTADYPVIVHPVNDLPTISAVGDQTVNEDSQTGVLAFTVGDTETPAASLTVTAATSDGTLLPEGRVTISTTSATGRTVRVRPGDHRNGTGVVTLTVTDADGGTATETFNVTVNPVNDNPAAVNDTATVNEDNPVDINVLANDTDVDLQNEGDNLTIASTAGVDHGTVDLLADEHGVEKKLLRFNPALNWNGTETFTYTMRDSAGKQSSASVTVTVSPVNDGPTAVADTATVNEDASVVIQVLTNDTDPDKNMPAETLSVIGVTDPPHGTTSYTASNVTYVPDANYFGSDSFSYTMQDAAGVQSSATVTVTVNSVNDLPTVTSLPVTSVHINEDGSGSIDFTVGDVETAAGSLTVTAASNNQTVIPNGNMIVNNLGGADRTITISPAVNRNTWNKVSGAHNPITITVTVQDANSGTKTGTFTVIIDPLNDEPTPQPDSATTSEDTPKTIDVLANDDLDLNLEGDPALSVYSFSQPENGTVTQDGKLLTYTPDLNWNGTDTFTYVAVDAANHPSEPVTVTMTVTAVNDAPVPQDDTASVNEDGSVTIDVLANDGDPDLGMPGDNLTISNAASVENGQADVAGDKKSLTFTPDPNWSGEASFTYTVVDTAGASATANVTVTVHPQADDPTAANDSASGNEGNTLRIDALANDGDPDLPYGDELTIVSVGTPAAGSAAVETGGKAVLYTPPADWNGSLSLSYTLEDKTGRWASASISITIQPANDDPVAAADEATTNEDAGVTIAVLENDSDVDLDETLNQGDVVEELTVSTVTQPAHGTAAVTPDEKGVIYTPDANYNGSDSFTYKVVDLDGAEDEATVSMTITALNDNPAAAADSVNTLEESPITVSVLANDSDTDLDGSLNHPITEDLLVDEISQPSHGTTAIEPGNKTVTYTPVTHYNGSDSFTYTLIDQGGKTATATVTIQVGQVNDLPQAVDDTAETTEELAVTLNVLANDKDADLEPAVNQDEVDHLTLITVSEPAHGTVTFDGDGTVTYTPALNYFGKDEFTYEMADGSEETASATITINVNEAVNDAPVAADDTAEVDEDGSIEIDVLTNDSDIDLEYEGDDLTIAIVEDVDHATVTIADDAKTLTFTPDPDWNGTETFTYTVQDEGELQDVGSVTVTVRPINDAPVIAPVSNKTIVEDTPSEAFAFTISDVDNDAAALVVTAALSSETVIEQTGVTLAGSGADRTIRFTPLANKNSTGRDPVTVTLTVSDGSLAGTQAFAVTVSAVNDAPVAAADSAEMNEDQSLDLSPLANDSDIDLANEGDNLTIAAVSGVEHAKVTIIDGGKKLRFTPDANWFGTETFTYTVKDSGGLEATATITIKVRDVAEPVTATPNPVGKFNVLTPRQGEQYKDGQTVHVSWTAPSSTTPLTYVVEFFDGAAWKTLAVNLKAESYDHVLAGTGLHTDAAQYRVTAWNGANAQQAEGQTIIIDNHAPAEITLALRTEDGSEYQPGTWTNQPVQIEAVGGYDLTGIQLQLQSENGTVLAESDLQNLTVTQSGRHLLKVLAVDPLGNRAVIGEVTIQIDSAPPAGPVVQTEEKPDSNGTVTFHFQPDPGESGNQTLVLPDGTRVSASGDVSWTPTEPGVYTLTLIDSAGNETTFEVVVPGPKSEPRVEEGAAEPAAQTRPAWNWLLLFTSLACSAGLLLLLMLLLGANVRIEYHTRQPDGSLRRHVRRRWAFAPGDKALALTVPAAETYEIRLGPGLTRSLRGGSLSIRHEQGSSQTTPIPQDTSGRFTAHF